MQYNNYYTTGYLHILVWITFSLYTINTNTSKFKGVFVSTQNVGLYGIYGGMVIYFTWINEAAVVSKNHCTSPSFGLMSCAG
jgi:hypothetical protein